MKTHLAYLTACIALFAVAAVPVSAQVDPDIAAAVDDVSDEELSPDSAADSAAESPDEIVADFSVHIPKKMIADISYEGVLLILEPKRHDITVSLATDSNLLEIPSTVAIPTGSNHVIFELTPQSPQDGTVTVHAITNDAVAQDSSTVYSVALHPTALMISAPISDDSITVSTDDVPVKVFLVDNHQIPIIAKQETEITISSSSPAVQFSNGGTLTDTVTLRVLEGQYSANAVVRVGGDGTIYATSDGLESDSLEILYDTNSPKVRLGIAPDIALANSIGYYYVWLEQDDSIYIPDEVLDVYLSSSDPDKVSFRTNENDDELYHTYMSRGTLRSHFYIEDASEDYNDAVVITVSVPGYGSHSEEILVMPPVQLSERPKIDVLKLWVHPTTPADTAWATVGLYHILNDTHAFVERYDGNLNPITSLDTVVSVSGDDGLKYPTEIKFDTILSDEDSTHFTFSAMDIPIDINTKGEHAISVQNSNAESAEIQFNSDTAYGFKHILQVTPIPIPLGTHGDIAYMSIVDKSGHITDVGGIVDTEKTNVIQAGNSLADIGINDYWVGGTNIITGTYLKEGAKIFVQIPGINSETTSLDTSGVKTGIEIWTPSRVNVFKEFPVAIHAVDSNGIPIALITDLDSLNISSEQITANVKDDHVRFVVENEGTTNLNIISDNRYLGSAVIKSFANDAESEVQVISPTPNVLKLGSEIILDIFTGALQNPDVSISGLDFEVDASDNYVATPTAPGQYSVTVNVEKDGWKKYTENVNFTVEELVDVVFNAIADDGVSVAASFDLESSATAEKINVKNGLYYTIHPGVFEISIDADLNVGTDRQYELQKLSLNGEEINHAEKFTLRITQDSTITGAYQRVIEIDFGAFLDSNDVFADISGNGHHRYGDVVVLHAPIATELYGLIWHVPEEWIGLPEDAKVSADGQSVLFVADESVTGTVVYEKTYTVLILLIASSVIVPFVLVWKKSPDVIMNLRDYVSTLKEKSRSVKIPKKLPKGIASMVKK